MKTAGPVFGASGRRMREGGLLSLSSGTLRHLEESLSGQWARYRKKLKRCQRNFSEKAVHELRVETRRLLSLVKLLRPFISGGCARKVERLLKRQRDIFDDLRDTQVQLLAVGRMLPVFPAARPFHAYLLKREGRFRKEARRRIKQTRTGRLDELLIACRRDVKARRKAVAPGMAATMLARLVERAFARTRELFVRIDPADTGTIHRTRIAFKKFRYMVETLAGYLAGANGKVLAGMHHYQAMMGDIQDIEVLLRALDKFLLKKKLQKASIRGLREELLRCRERLIRAYAGSADQLLEFWPLPGGPPAARPVRQRASRPRNLNPKPQVVPARNRAIDATSNLEPKGRRP